MNPRDEGGEPERLRLAPPESPEELARRYEREKRLITKRQEKRLEESGGCFRIGSVPYLNAVPLTRGLEGEAVFETPARLGEMLAAGELDAALVSVVEPLFHDGYDILDGIAVASLGEVRSVFLAHRCPLGEVREVHADPASLTSVELLRVLLAERGIRPAWRRLESYDPAGLPDCALLIGDPAIRVLRAGTSHAIWDLGAAWYEMTGLPFVFAVWALRRGSAPRELTARLRDARNFGMETIDQIIRNYPDFDADFRRDYLTWHIHYHLGSDEKRGLARFVELLRKYTDREVFEPRFAN